MGRAALLKLPGITGALSPKNKKICVEPLAEEKNHQIWDLLLLAYFSWPQFPPTVAKRMSCLPLRVWRQ